MPPESPPSGPPARPLRLLLFAGVMLVYLSVWKGDGGYLDLREYLDDAERLWLRGDLSDPQTPPDAPKQYHRYALGLPFLAGPMVYVGAVAKTVSAGAVGTRSVAALTVPIYGALACVLLYSIGLRAGFSIRVSLWAALIFGLGGPIVSYTRLFYAEVPLAFCLFMGLWAHLHARQAGTIGRSSCWAVLAGAGLAGVAACHYPNAILAGIVWLAFTATWVLDRERSAAERARAVAGLLLVPVMTGLALMYLNYAHFGHPFRTGYHVAHADIAGKLFAVSYVPENLAQIARWLVRVPWAPIGLACWARARGDRSDRGLLAPPLRASALIAYAAQAGFWLTFMWFPMFGLRYQMPLMALAAPGLLVLGAWLERRWPARGLGLAGALLFTWNLLGVLRGDDSSQIVFADPLGRVCSYVWYMRPFDAGQPEGFGTPADAAQLAIFLALALPGVALLFIAACRANSVLRNSGSLPTPQ